MQSSSVRLSSAVISDKGLSEKRPVNEDSFLALVDRGLFAVADGVGGAQAGDFASQTAMEVLHQAFSHLQPNIDPEELLEMAIQRANESIYQMSHELPQFDMMATTIVTLQIIGNVATIGHVGDSRLYRLDPNGELSRETNDHSIVEEEVRAGRMTAAQAANHPSRNVISRALGAESTVEVEMRTIMFEPGTVFLLCSDGITRHVTDNEIKSVLTNYHSLDDACQEFKRMCYERGAEDNLTALVVRVDGANARVAAPVEDENTILTRPAVAAVNVSSAAASNGAARAAETTEKRREEFASSSVVSPEANTAPLDTASVADALPGLGANPTKTRESAAAQIAGAPHNVAAASSNATAANAAAIAAPVNEAKPNGAKKLVHLGSDADIIEQISQREAQTAPIAAKHKWVNSLVLLLVGAAVGAGLIYALTMLNPPSANAPATVNTVAQPSGADSAAQINVQPQNAAAPASTPNAEATTTAAPPSNELNTLETRRRSIDNQPRNANKIVEQPQTAADYYLLGRAALQIGEYERARRALDKADDLIGELDNANQETLRVDVATALAALSVLTKKGEDARPLNELIKSKRIGKSNNNDKSESNRE